DYVATVHVRSASAKVVRTTPLLALNGTDEPIMVLDISGHAHWLVTFTFKPLNARECSLGVHFDAPDIHLGLLVIVRIAQIGVDLIGRGISWKPILAGCFLFKFRSESDPLLFDRPVR